MLLQYHVVNSCMLVRNTPVNICLNLPHSKYCIFANVLIPMLICYIDVPIERAPFFSTFYSFYISSSNVQNVL